MNQKRITAIVLTGFILIGLVLCGVIGYMNDNSGRAYPDFGFPDEPFATETPIAIDLIYCYNPVDLCIISFGQDSAGNLLIVVRNNIPGLKEFYAKLQPVETLGLSPTDAPSLESTQTSDLYTCQKVQFASDIYYCMGNLIPDGTMVTMSVYSKSDDRLIASGRIPVSAEATPAPTTKETATLIAEPTNAEVFTVTPELIKTATPTPTILSSATVITPAYPYPYPYPYSFP